MCQERARTPEPAEEWTWRRHFVYFTQINLPRICPGFTCAQMEFNTCRGGSVSLTHKFSTLSVICILLFAFSYSFFLILILWMCNFSSSRVLLCSFLLQVGAFVNSFVLLFRWIVCGLWFVCELKYCAESSLQFAVMNLSNVLWKNSLRSAWFCFHKFAHKCFTCSTSTSTWRLSEVRS